MPVTVREVRTVRDVPVPVVPLVRGLPSDANDTNDTNDRNDTNGWNDTNSNHSNSSNSSNPSNVRDLQTPRDPDALYRDRENLASAREAANIWTARVETNAADFESWWKLARAYYWLGGHGPQESRRPDLERGVAAAERAAALAVNRPEGHFWKAANMGALAESFGLLQGVKYRGAIRESLETVLKLDPGFQQGSADRALGRWYFKVPGLFGGSKKKSEEHLRKSLTYNANSHASRFFLAETLFSMDRDSEAVDELNRILAAPIDSEWAPEDREFKRKARELLSARSRR